MRQLVNYKKRGVELPKGCKDLIDVLQGPGRAKAPLAAVGQQLGVALGLASEHRTHARADVAEHVPSPDDDAEHLPENLDDVVTGDLVHRRNENGRSGVRDKRSCDCRRRVLEISRLRALGPFAAVPPAHCGAGRCRVGEPTGLGGRRLGVSHGQNASGMPLLKRGRTVAT